MPPNSQLRIASQTSAPVLLRLCDSHAAELGPVHLVTALHRLAKCPAGPAFDIWDLRFQNLCARWQHFLQDSSPRWLSNSIWALAVLVCRD
jgi:hypothetical protein